MCDPVHRDGSNLKAFNVLVRTTMAMVGVPALAMLSCHYVFLDMFFTFRSPSDKMLWSGVAGIAAVQFVVVCFLWHAFTESTDEPVAAVYSPSKKTS